MNNENYILYERETDSAIRLIQLMVATPGTCFTGILAFGYTSLYGYAYNMGDKLKITITLNFGNNYFYWAQLGSPCLTWFPVIE